MNVTYITGLIVLRSNIQFWSDELFKHHPKCPICHSQPALEETFLLGSIAKA